VHYKKIKNIGAGLVWLLPHPALLRSAHGHTFKTFFSLLIKPLTHLVTPKDLLIFGEY